MLKRQEKRKASLIKNPYPMNLFWQLNSWFLFSSPVPRISFENVWCKSLRMSPNLKDEKILITCHLQVLTTFMKKMIQIHFLPRRKSVPVKFNVKSELNWSSSAKMNQNRGSLMPISLDHIHVNVQVLKNLHLEFDKQLS